MYVNKLALPWLIKSHKEVMYSTFVRVPNAISLLKELDQLLKVCHVMQRFNNPLRQI